MFPHFARLYVSFMLFPLTRGWGGVFRLKLTLIAMVALMVRPERAYVCMCVCVCVQAILLCCSPRCFSAQVEQQPRCNHTGRMLPKHRFPALITFDPFVEAV